MHNITLSSSHPPDITETLLKWTSVCPAWTIGKPCINQLLQLCTACTVFSILVTLTVRLYTVMPEVCRWLTFEKQRKTDIVLADQ